MFPGKLTILRSQVAETLDYQPELMSKQVGFFLHSVAFSQYLNSNNCSSPSPKNTICGFNGRRMMS